MIAVNRVWIRISTSLPIRCRARPSGRMPLFAAGATARRTLLRCCWPLLRASRRRAGAQEDGPAVSIGPPIWQSVPIVPGLRDFRPRAVATAAPAATSEFCRSSRKTAQASGRRQPAEEASGGWGRPQGGSAAEHEPPKSPPGERSALSLRATLRRNGHTRPAKHIEAAVDQVLETAIPLEKLGVQPGDAVSLFLELFAARRSLERVPAEGAIELTAPTPDYESLMWQA